MFRGKILKAAVSFALSFVFAASSMVITASAAQPAGIVPIMANIQQPTQTPAEYTRVTPGARTPRYLDYMGVHTGAEFTGHTVRLGPNGITDRSDNISVEQFQGRNAIITEEIGYVTFTANIPATGMYAIEIDYFPIVEHTTAAGRHIKGTGGPIERTVFVNGDIPFNEAWAMEMTRIYVDMQEFDANGNPIRVSGNRFRPQQEERPRWNTVSLSDQFGYFGKALYFYLEAGTQQITLRSIREPVAISEIRLVSEDYAPMSYDDYYAMWRSRGARDVNSDRLRTTVISGFDRRDNVLTTSTIEGMITIPAEEPLEKGDPTLFAFNDTQSTQTLPHDPRIRRMNAIGGESWQFSNQWISWEFEVPESGFYNISFRARQTFTRDINSNRSIYIQGPNDDIPRIPFAEAATVKFPYDTNWYTTTATAEDGTPLRFYLEAGTNVIKLKITAGAYADILTRAEYVMTNLTRINLEFISVITANPDRDRDYNLGRRMPHTFDELRYYHDVLAEIREDMMKLTGNSNDALTSQLQMLMRSITRLYDRPDDVPRNYRPFRDSVLGLGQWMMTVREHALVLDRIIITAPSEQPPNIKEDNFLDRLWVILIGFINSFITSYSMLSEDLEGDFVTVWIGGATGGRDQALAFNQIIVRDFTSVRRGADNKHIPVNLQLVGTGVILVATLAGRGPDLTLSVGVGDPVNFALRSAVEDLTQFPDFWEVTERFFPGTLTPFMLDKEDGNGVGVYALPETAVFPMLFYRTDVLQDIGVDPDELRTWQSIIEMYPELLAQNMEFGLPSTFGTFMMFMYQMEIELYRDGYVAANLDDPRSLEAFRFFTDFYLEFSMPRDYDFANRFRTGEMPVAIADYTQFNLISIFAPELRGRWNMVPVPGFEQICPVTQEMIGINAIVPIGVGGAIMMANSRLKDDAWEFLKWWTDADAQFNFGRQLEAVMGGAARWNTANMEAFERMPWTAEIRQNLATQIGLMQNDMPERFMVGDIVPGFGLKGVPEVPGGYYTGRHFDFARNDVLNDNVNDRQDPRQRLLRAVIYINNEITRRREEFNMSLTEDEWRRRNN